MVKYLSRINYKPWSAFQTAELRRLYPIIEKATAEKHFGRTWRAISGKAEMLGLKRPRENFTKHKAHKVFVTLRQARQAKRIKIEELAQTTGYGRVSLTRYETGSCLPSWQRILDWCEALDMELIAVPKR